MVTTRKGKSTRSKTTKKKNTGTKTVKPAANKERVFWIKAPIVATSAADERKQKAEARRKIKGVTFTKR